MKFDVWKPKLHSYQNEIFTSFQRYMQSILFYWSKFHSSSPLFTIWISFKSLLSCSYTLEFLRILRVTPLLFIVLVCREGSHWVLAILLLIRDCGLTQFKRIKKFRGSLYASQGFGIFPFIPAPLALSLYLFYLIYQDNFA